MIQCNYLHSQPSDAAADAEFVAMATRTTITITDSSRPVAANKELFSLLETVAVVPEAETIHHWRCTVHMSFTADSSCRQPYST